MERRGLDRIMRKGMRIVYPVIPSNGFREFWGKGESFEDRGE